MSLVIFSFLFSSTYYVPVKGEIVWYLSHTVWLISLNIMLSSSIHAVAKGISSFFLVQYIFNCTSDLIVYFSLFLPHCSHCPYMIYLCLKFYSLPIFTSVLPHSYKFSSLSPLNNIFLSFHHLIVPLSHILISVISLPLYQ